MEMIFRSWLMNLVQRILTTWLILLDKIVKDTNELAAGRTSGCGDGCCMHKDMAAYYNMRAGGMSSDLADIYMYGYYVVVCNNTDLNI
jgi:hypothetical protein